MGQPPPPKKIPKFSKKFFNQTRPNSVCNFKSTSTRRFVLRTIISFVQPQPNSIQNKNNPIGCGTAPGNLVRTFDGKKNLIRVVRVKIMNQFCSGPTLVRGRSLEVQQRFQRFPLFIFESITFYREETDKYNAKLPHCKTFSFPSSRYRDPNFSRTLGKVRKSQDIWKWLRSPNNYFIKLRLALLEQIGFCC